LNKSTFYFIAGATSQQAVIDLRILLGSQDKWLIVGSKVEDTREHAVSMLGTNEPTSEAGSLERLLHLQPDHLIVLAPDLRQSILDSYAALIEELADETSYFAILVQRRAPPQLDDRDDGVVASFICSASILRTWVPTHSHYKISQLCFDLLEDILSGRLKADKIMIKQVPYVKPDLPCEQPRVPVAVLMAHRGYVEHLKTALTFLEKAKIAGLSTRVCLDVDDPRPYIPLIREHTQTDFFCARPAPVGPYVIRQELAERSPEPILAFHDSDDISCSDRFTRMYSEMLRTNCDLIGCHELRLDEIQRKIYAVRFPVNASAALRIHPGHALLHGTALIRRDGFFSAGGLSTNLMIASDSQFLLRAYFTLKIRNVNDFYYIRRLHWGAATVAPETALGNPLRSRLNYVWQRDFELVKNKLLDLSESSLCPARRMQNYQFVKIDSQRVDFTV
jgi:hypothetical protein